MQPSRVTHVCVSSCVFGLRCSIFLFLMFFVFQNFQEGFAPKEAWSWTALSERFGDSMVRVSLSQTGRCDSSESVSPTSR